MPYSSRDREEGAGNTIAKKTRDDNSSTCGAKQSRDDDGKELETLEPSVTVV